MNLQTHVRGRTRLLLALILFLGVMTIIDDYRGWRFLLLALGSVWWLSWLWARSLARSLHLRREMRFGWAQVGDQLEERFTLTNQGTFPGPCIEIVDHSNMPGYQNNLVTGIDNHDTTQWRTKGVCSRRGLFTLGPTTLRTTDPLGFYQVELHDPSSVTLMVTPPIVPLHRIEVAPGGRAGQGPTRPNAPERTVSAAGVREYLPSDSMRYIHWRTSARRDELYVRLFESTPSGDWWIILDMDLSVQVGEDNQSTEEHGVILAASLADRGLRQGKAVGLVAHGEALVWLPPREGDGQRWEILRSLALINPTHYPLGKLLSNLSPTLGRYTSLVIITPNARGDWLESLLPLLWQGAVPTVLLLDPASFGGHGETGGVLGELSRWGVHLHVITPDLLNRPEAHPGKSGKWEWRISPTGRAVPVSRPRDTSWKGLS